MASMFGIGQGELIFIVLLAIIVLGPKRLPEATRMIARFYHLILRWKEEIQAQLSEIREEMEKEAGDFKDALSVKPAEYETEGRQAPKPALREELDDYITPLRTEKKNGDDAYTYKSFIKTEEESANANRRDPAEKSEHNAQDTPAGAKNG